MSRNRTVTIVAAAIAVLAAVVIGVMAMLSGGSKRELATPVIVPVARASMAPATRATGGRRVGVYLSKTTGTEVGYSCQMTGDLLNQGMEVIPLLEPGSDSEPAVKKLLGVYFRGQQPLDVTRTDDLKTLDVIVAPRIWMLPEAARSAIEETVRAGTGLLVRNGMGCMEPGSGEAVSRLSGFDESSFGYNAHPMECEVIAEHPLLGTLKPGTSVTITPNGTWGLPGAKTVPLIRVKDMAKFREFYHHGDPSWVFYPLYIGELGKGRIVGCQWPAWERMPKDLQTATDSQFNVRAVKWLARKETPSTREAVTTNQ